MVLSSKPLPTMSNAGMISCRTISSGSTVSSRDRVAAAAWSFNPFTTARCKAERKFSSWGAAAAAAGAAAGAWGTSWAAKAM